MTIKAIETQYKGYRFRSRLEARWAVFLDSLGFEWRYEEEGFELDGVRFLPDFFVPAWRAWVEVKSGALIDEARRGEAGAVTAAREKAGLLHKHSGRRVLLLAGDPWPREHAAILFAGWEDGEECKVGEFALCLSCGALGLANDAEEVAPERQFWGVLADAPPHTTCTHAAGPWLPRTRGEGEPGDHLGRAFLMARRARFEFGEHGR